MNALHFLPPGLPADRVATILGLVSDTHMPQRLAAFPPALYHVLQGVDLLLHAGDVGELQVLDQLSVIAPVIAVHGNDETPEAQAVLPYQQLVTIHKQRILLWHSHFPDRVDELDSRREDALLPKFNRSLERAKRCGAKLVVFGHWHIPLAYRENDLLLINPGAIAPGNPYTRQLRQTLALLFLRDDGAPFVSHVDLAAPDQIYTPQIEWHAGFQAALAQFSTSILAPELEPHRDYLAQQLAHLGFEYTLPALLRVTHRCWRGQQPFFTLNELLHEVRIDPELSPARKAQYEAALMKIGD